jgi:hypothetical protein
MFRADCRLGVCFRGRAGLLGQHGERCQ